MTVKLVVLYTQPADPVAFERHYFDKHMPLVAVMPGLLRTETGKFGAPAGSGGAYHRLTELYFADQAALDAAFGSAEGKATAADYRDLAPPGSLLLVQELDD